MEVDSESAAREQLRGFWDAFAEAMKFLVLAVVSVAGGAATEIAKEAVKKGAVSGVSATTAAGAVAVVGAVVVVSAALWAAWAPADIVALDVFTIDALTAARNTDGKTAIGGATERSWRVEEEWMVVRERPLPKVGNPGELAMTWVQENEYRSGGEDSRYVLEFRLAQRPTA